MRTLLLLVFGMCVLVEPVLAQARVAIVGGTVVNVRDGSLIPGAVVVIEGDRIVSVSAAGQAPAGSTVIDARGKYLIPGFIDTHVHYKDWAAELFVNHGVTTVLAESNDWARAQAEGIEKGTIPGPRYFFDGRLGGERKPKDVVQKALPVERVYVEQISYPSLEEFLDQGGPAPSNDPVVRNPAEVRERMKDYVSGKIKVHSIKLNHSIEDLQTLRAIVQEANKINVPVKGHLRNARLAADAGVTGMEHSWAVGVSLVDMDARAKALQKVTKDHMPPVEAFMDMKKVPELVKYLVERNVSLDPTLRMTFAGIDEFLKKGFYHEEVDLLFGDWRLSYIPLDWKLANLKEFHELDVWHRNDLTQYDRDLWDQGYKNIKYFIKVFVDAGGKLHAGTDCATMCVPGLGTHQELELFVDAGLTPLQALQSATIWSAELMRMQDRLGTIEVGKAADVVVLDANPLENIRNTRKIAKVISMGRIVDGQYHADFQNPIPAPTLGEGSGSHFFRVPQIQRASQEGASIVVQGKGFLPYSFVVLNGKKLKTEYLDNWRLRAVIPSEFLKEGTLAITVENPNWAAPYIRVTGRPRAFDHVSNAFVLFVKPLTGS